MMVPKVPSKPSHRDETSRPNRKTPIYYKEPDLHSLWEEMSRSISPHSDAMATSNAPTPKGTEANSSRPLKG